jgi:hypothetical protein
MAWEKIYDTGLMLLTSRLYFPFASPFMSPSVLKLPPTIVINWITYLQKVKQEGGCHIW